MKKLLLVFGFIISGLTSSFLNAQSNWSFQTNPIADSALGKIQFVSSTEGWISEAHGRMLHTTNAGTDWSVVTPFPSDTVTSMTDPANSMWWADQKHGWKINWLGTSFADAHGAVIQRTTDGGNSWTKNVLSTVAGEMGFQIQFVDTNNGWASVYNYSLGSMVTLRSTNGGSNWDTVATSGIFYFVDTNNGWSIGGTKIYHTANGGNNWSLQYTSAGTGGFNAVQFTDLNHGWVVGDSCKILKTTDGGGTWTPITNTGISSNFRSKGLFFVNANFGWIGSKIVNMPISSDVGINLYTTNGGASWTTQSFPGAENSDNVWSIFFWDANNGWFTTDAGKIGHTTNGGGTTAIVQAKNTMPAGFSLSQNYPNPFNPTTLITYNVPAVGTPYIVSLKVFDVLGREVATLVNETKSAGTYNATFNASKFASGVYFYQLKAGNILQTKKMILMK